MPSFTASPALLQTEISSSVRQQPSHNPDFGDIMQTEMQGEGKYLCKSLPAALPSPCRTKVLSASVRLAGKLLHRYLGEGVSEQSSVIFLSARSVRPFPQLYRWQNRQSISNRRWALPSPASLLHKKHRATPSASNRVSSLPA